MTDHVRNKIAEASDDELTCLAIRSAVSLVESASADYAVIGSCGLQSYLDCFYRPPNDLDLVLPEDHISAVAAIAQQRGHVFVQQLGRARLYIDRFPVHLIPLRMNVIDKTTSKIFASVDHSAAVGQAKPRKLILVGTTVTPVAKVAPLEPIVLGHLIRSIDTGTAMGLGLVLSRNTLDLAVMGAMATENEGVHRVIRARIREYPAILDRLTVLSADDRTRALAQLVALQDRL